MKQLVLTIFTYLTFISLMSAQSKPAYLLFKNNGKPADYDKMIKDLAESDMVFFGEYHNNPISHWMQLEMSKSFFEIKGDKLYFGAEMFENRKQMIINEYLIGYYYVYKILIKFIQ